MQFPTWGQPNDSVDFAGRNKDGNLQSIAQLRQQTESLGRTAYGDPAGTLMPFAASKFDMFWVGFLALDAVDRQLRAETPPKSLLDFTPTTSTDIAAMLTAAIKQVRFHGASGLMAFNDNGDLQGQIYVQQYRPSTDSATAQFVNVFKFSRSVDDPSNPGDLQLLSPLQFNTPNGLPPSDGSIPPKTVDDERAVQQKTLVVIVSVVVTAIGIVTIACVIAVVWYKRKLRQSLANPSWLVNFQALGPTNLRNKSRWSISQSRYSFSNSNYHSMSTMELSSAILGGATDDAQTRLFTLDEQTVYGQTVTGTPNNNNDDTDQPYLLEINANSHKLLTCLHDNLQHPNLVRFVGYSVAPPSRPLSTKLSNINHYKYSSASQQHQSTNIRQQYLLWEYCEKGSLQQLVIENDSFKLDATFELALMLDVAQGMAFLHKSSSARTFGLDVHGALTADACLVDRRFSVKIAAYGDKVLAPLFGLDTLRSEQQQEQQLCCSRCMSNNKPFPPPPDVLPKTTTTKAADNNNIQVTAVIFSGIKKPIFSANCYAYTLSQIFALQ